MGKTINIRNNDEIHILKEANRIVAIVLDSLKNKIYPGISTHELDEIAKYISTQHGAVPAFKGYKGYPANLCVSINEQVVHGIPSKKSVLKEGDLVSIDFGVKYKGYFGDAAITVPVGQIDIRKKKLLKVTEEALLIGISYAKVGNRINDISSSIQNFVEKNGFSVVKQFVGHGIGTHLHEPPEIPNYSRNETTPRLLEGMVLAIEPMVNMGTSNVKVAKDGWTVTTVDKQPSAHFEHSIVITSNGPDIMSAILN